MNLEKSNRAREVIEQAFLVVKSVDFLEKQSNKLMSEINALEKELESCEDFLRKEEIIKLLEQKEPQLRQLIRRCQFEYENIERIHKIAL
jgi:uncharacterized protein YlxW (UPF0749 family)